MASATTVTIQKVRCAGRSQQCDHKSQYKRTSLKPVVRGDDDQERAEQKDQRQQFDAFGRGGGQRKSGLADPENVLPLMEKPGDDIGFLHGYYLPEAHEASGRRWGQAVRSAEPSLFGRSLLLDSRGHVRDWL